MINLETACRANLVHLEFREGVRWTFVDPKNSQIVSPAFGEREDAEAWQRPYLEQQEAQRRAAAEAKAARAAAEKAAAEAAHAHAAREPVDTTSENLTEHTSD